MRADTSARINERADTVQQPDKAKWIAENLNLGEVYAGILLGENGAPDHHLILLPGDVSDVTWPQAMDWAAKEGGVLPTRREQSLLFANAKAAFQNRWYWSSEQHAANSDSAWIQYFGGGGQHGSHKSFEGRARAVRRLIIL
jgi:hypothetical protein